MPMGDFHALLTRKTYGAISRNEETTIATNLLVLFEAVAWFSSFHAAGWFWYRLKRLLVFLEDRMGQPLQNLVTWYCEARRIFHRRHIKASGLTIPKGEILPNCFVRAVDSVISKLALPPSTDLSVPGKLEAAWLAREASWPVKLKEILSQSVDKRSSQPHRAHTLPNTQGRRLCTSENNVSTPSLMNTGTEASGNDLLLDTVVRSGAISVSKAGKGRSRKRKRRKRARNIHLETLERDNIEGSQQVERTQTKRISSESGQPAALQSPKIESSIASFVFSRQYQPSDFSQSPNQSQRDGQTWSETKPTPQLPRNILTQRDTAKPDEHKTFESTTTESRRAEIHNESVFQVKVSTQYTASADLRSSTRNENKPNILKDDNIGGSQSCHTRKLCDAGTESFCSGECDARNIQPGLVEGTNHPWDVTYRLEPSRKRLASMSLETTTIKKPRLVPISNDVISSSSGNHWPVIGAEQVEKQQCESAALMVSQEKTTAPTSDAHLECNETLLPVNNDASPTSILEQPTQPANATEALEVMSEEIQADLNTKLLDHQSRDVAALAFSQTHKRLALIESHVARLVRTEEQRRTLEDATASNQCIAATNADNIADATAHNQSLAWSTGGHLRYLRSLEAKPFLSGVDAEIAKIRACIRQKIREQDETDEGWRIMDYLGDVLWTLDNAMVKAKKGAKAL